MAACYSDEHLIEILRALAADLGRSPTIQELLARPGLPAPRTYANHFGNWNAALAAAGLETRRRVPTYSDEQLLVALRDLAAELGRPPTVDEMLARSDAPAPRTFASHFGNWNKALKAAGLEPRPGTGDLAYSDEQLLEILRDLAAELGWPPTTQELLARDGLPSHNTYVHRFGSWNAALEAAGLETRRRGPPCTDEELLAALRDLAEELGRPPSYSEMLARRDLPSPGACQRYFGGWNAALEAAGLEPHQPIRTATYTDERLLEILRHLAAELGRSPTAQEMRKRRDLPRPETYKRFGSWNAALEAAGLETRRHSLDYTDAQLLQILRDLAAELGKTPTQLELRARRDLPSPTTYHRHFGTWNAALRAAGVGAGRG